MRGRDVRARVGGRGVHMYRVFLYFLMRLCLLELLVKGKGHWQGCRQPARLQHPPLGGGAFA